MKIVITRPIDSCEEITCLELSVYFTSIRTTHENGTLKINTICIINRDPEIFLSSGEARLFHRDQYNKWRGKKVSFARALAGVVLSKEVRKHAWDVFFSTHPKAKK
jgi:hypothetical protein